MRKRAFVSGCTGMDGSHLSDLLLEKGYEVWGLVRRSSEDRPRLRSLECHPYFQVVHGDLCDPDSMAGILAQIMPQEVYNLAAQSHVSMSFRIPVYTFEANTVGFVRLLEQCRSLATRPKIYQASSSEMWGSAPPPQNEETPFRPRSPYAVSKLASHRFLQNYRDAYGLFACSGMLVNHEGPRRGEGFVTQKIARGAAAIKLGLMKKLLLGNLEAKRDWGWAPDFVRGMWMMLQHEHPDDYVLATGKTHSVQDFVQAAFAELEMDWHDYVEFDPNLMRPTDVNELCGDASKAKAELGWEPTMYFSDIVTAMVRHAYDQLKHYGGGVRLDV